jgi:hypothetical protein
MPLSLSRLLSGLCLAGALLATPATAQDEAPPRSDTFDHLSDFLACSGNPYALCYYSGPETATPPDQDATPPLPCTIDGPLRADCTCYAITEPMVEPGLRYNFVLIDSILDPIARAENELQCNEDGSNCLNMAHLASGICNNADDPHVDEYEFCQEAPVCSRLGDIATGEIQTLYPESDATLISTFSFYSSQVHDFGSTDCSDHNIRLYAGCMTAPCTDDDGDGLAECSCPLYDGPYQVGQDYDGLQCNILPNVWSAANNATTPPHLPGALGED